MADSKFDNQPSYPKINPPEYHQTGVTELAPERLPAQQVVMQPAPVVMPPQAPFVVQSNNVHSGNCPVCHMGFLQKRYERCCLIFAILGAIFCFPIGLLYLCCLKEERMCSACGYKM